MRGGEAGQYSPGVSAALMKIVPYSASLNTVFHSVFYNSVVLPLLLIIKSYFYFYLIFQVASRAKVLRNEAAFLANKLDLFTASYLN